MPFPEGDPSDGGRPRKQREDKSQLANSQAFNGHTYSQLSSPIGATAVSPDSSPQPSSSPISTPDSSSQHFGQSDILAEFHLGSDLLEDSNFPFAVLESSGEEEGGRESDG